MHGRSFPLIPIRQGRWEDFPVLRLKQSLQVQQYELDA